MHFSIFPGNILFIVEFKREYFLKYSHPSPMPLINTFGHVISRKLRYQLSTMLGIEIYILGIPYALPSI